ncbi:RagB/SusD family nutrient uptake outer membrane protein [Polaribacter sp.]|uniref:RagB/SusD family nutrient uptake outer membrane protein n=1 Tax=Polaribacter sp. TaxID=1920175 RepID=UPI003EF9ED15
MKKYIITLLVLVVAITSCDNRLDTFPTSTVATEEAFKGEGDFTNALNGAYESMLIYRPGGGTAPTVDYYGGVTQGLEVLSDNLIISRDGRFSQQARYDWNYDQNSGYFFSRAAYATIRNANAILGSIDNLEAGTFKNNVMGEALTLRALAHFDVIKYYGEIPTQNAGSNGTLAMPYIEIADINDLPSRDLTIGEFYQKIVDDLTTAASIIGSTTANGTYRTNADAANGILANVYLHMGNMPAAVTAANKVTTPVVSRTSFTGIWNDSDRSGILFGLRNDDATEVTLGVPYSQTAGGIKDEYVPDFAFYSLYASNDIRKTAYFVTSPFSGENYNHIIKWYSSVSTTQLGVVDAKIIRASEVMLIKAEALAAQNLDGSALTALDAVRSQRYSGFTSGGETGQALKDAIQLERRLELAFEGVRFTDLKRFGMAITRSNFGYLADGSGEPADELTLPAGDYRFNLPISVNELNLNPNMSPTAGYIK